MVDITCSRGQRPSGPSARRASGGGSTALVGRSAALPTRSRPPRRARPTRCRDAEIVPSGTRC